jgi:hypothetical protein
MISQQEMLDMIATEAVEGGPPPPKPLRMSPKMLRRAVRSLNMFVRYDLRLVRHEDGRLEWRDE